jgi:hypothetical protein
MTLLSAIVLAALVAAPAGAAAKRQAGPDAAVRKLARANFAPFRHPAGATDRIAPALLTPVQRRRLRGAETRRFAAGPGWAAYLALEARRPGAGIHAFDDAELLVVGKGISLAQRLPTTARLRQIVATGAWATFTPAGGARTTVVVVSDAAKEARLASFGSDAAAAATPLDVGHNTIVAATPESATISWRRAGGPWLSVAVTGTNPGTPVSAELLDGSHVTADLGNGVVRTIPLSGTLYGFIPGGYRLSRDNSFVLTRGTFAISPTDLLTDGCANPALASTVPATQVTLDPAKQSSALVRADGTVSATVNAILHTVLSLRQANGCGLPSVPSGAADTALLISVGGRVERGSGLARLHLTSSPTPVSIQACLTPGDPGQGCAQPTAVPATLTTDVVVKVQIG